MRRVQWVAVAIVAVLASVGLAGCDSVGFDTSAVADTLAGMPGVASVSSDGSGMSLNTDAQSSIIVELDPAASSSQIVDVATAWHRASGELPNTSLTLALPASTGADSQLQFARGAVAEGDLAASVDAWYYLAQTYPRATTVYDDSEGITTLVADAAASPGGIAGLVDDLRAAGVSEEMSWWFYSEEPGETEKYSSDNSLTIFTRHHLPTEEFLTLIAGLDDAYLLAGELGGMNLDITEMSDAVSYSVGANLNPDSLRDLPADEVVTSLPDSDAWSVVQSLTAAVDPLSTVDVTFSAFGGDAFAELDTADCSKQDYASYAALGPAIWAEWLGGDGVTADGSTAEGCA